MKRKEKRKKERGILERRKRKIHTVVAVCFPLRRVVQGRMRCVLET